MYEQLHGVVIVFGWHRIAKKDVETLTDEIVNLLRNHDSKDHLSGLKQLLKLGQTNDFEETYNVVDDVKLDMHLQMFCRVLNQ